MEDRTYPTYHKSPLLHNVFKPVGYSPQKSSVKQQHPIYDNALDYGKVHLIHIPRDLQVQRAIADKENHEIIRAAKMKEEPVKLPPKKPAPVHFIPNRFYKKNRRIYSKVHSKLNLKL